MRILGAIEFSVPLIEETVDRDEVLVLTVTDRCWLFELMASSCCSKMVSTRSIIQALVKQSVN